VIIDQVETSIIAIKFYSYKQRLLGVGWNSNACKLDADRVESFEIAADEQLIGA
jgi:hypothetical protein